jgi:hypothetical protein
MDRSIRIFLGVLLVCLALTGVSIWGWIGLIPLLTGLFGTCPVYSLLGINTCRAK